MHRFFINGALSLKSAFTGGESDQDAVTFYKRWFASCLVGLYHVLKAKCS